MNDFLCWDPTTSSQDDAIEIRALTPADAAEKYASHQFDGDPFDQMTVCVRRSGCTLTYVVWTERIVDFCARLKTP